METLIYRFPNNADRQIYVPLGKEIGNTLENLGTYGNNFKAIEGAKCEKCGKVITIDFPATLDNSFNAFGTSRNGICSKISAARTVSKDLLRKGRAVTSAQTFGFSFGSISKVVTSTFILFNISETIPDPGTDL